MKISKVKVENYRLLKDFSIDLQEELSLVIGKNNTGKTSLLSVLDKFLNEKGRFSYDDFNIEFKSEFEKSVESTDEPEDFVSKGIKLQLFIEYNENDDLSNISSVLMDLDPDKNIIVLGFEYTVTYADFMILKKDYSDFKAHEVSKKEVRNDYQPRECKDFIKTRLDNYFKNQKKSYDYEVNNSDNSEKSERESNVSQIIEVKNIKVNNSNYIDLVKENISIRNIISFKYISAKRDVTNQAKGNTLSRQTSNLYKKQEDNSDKFKENEKFIEHLSETDDRLSGIYENIFEDVVKKVESFGGVKPNDTSIKIISTLQHRELLEGNTTVVYNQDKHQLPEHYNGLGYMNLISMIFEIEILVQDFKRDKDKKPADINLLIIEEPEAHTHPQMQYIFIKNIKSLLSAGIKKGDDIIRPLQYIITTHSSHIVADSDFDDIKYLKSQGRNSVVAKNLTDLKNEYDIGTTQYDFLKQYLTISRAEIFFADKAVLIEGDTERLLIPTFMHKIDLKEEKRLKSNNEKDAFLPLLSQNISTIEVGAYAQIFEKFIEFLGIKSLIITDIDSIGDISGTKKNGAQKLEACPVEQGAATSNSALKHFFEDPDWDSLKVFTIEQRTIKRDELNICLCYQQEEENYHARSFEDAFIHINLAFIKAKLSEFKGLKNKGKFENEINAYILAKECILKKTHFALDIIFNSNEDFSNWEIPAYIREGLLWLKKD